LLESSAVTRGRKRDLAGPALVLAGTGVVTGTALGAVLARRRRRSAQPSGEQPATVARRALEDPWQVAPEALADLVAASYVGHDPGEPEPVRGPEGLAARIEGYRLAFADARVAVDEQVCEGERVVSRWTLRGTHTGELAGIAATGKQVTVSGVTISRVEDGRLVESWTSWDRLGLLVQLGAVSEPAHA
jgi:steroid delta-isomerase-like uncharacterized protein